MNESKRKRFIDTGFTSYRRFKEFRGKRWMPWWPPTDPEDHLYTRYIDGSRPGRIFTKEEIDREWPSKEQFKSRLKIREI